MSVGWVFEIPPQSSRCDAPNKINDGEPLTLTISPKIRNLLETKAKIINDTLTSLKFPEQSGQLRGVNFRASINGKVEVGKTMFGRWIPLIGMSGGIKVTSETAALDVKLAWKNFKFTPTVTMDSNVNIGFTSSLWMLYFLRSKIEKEFTRRINIEVSKKLVEAIELQVNPWLQTLQQTMISMGYDHYDIDWAVQENHLRVSLKPKSLGAAPTPISPINNMLCVNLNMLTAVHETSKRMKREAHRRGVLTFAEMTVTLYYAASLAHINILCI
ncbi:hypothetical protein ANCDUO_07192 [Ancylostoma duodenale]|uniref:Lipid-binding serum glycoprotein N-terminal domain-containing protein n=1 Tax=Ancylostoma duodenale TaxID=51022 RepID=A0A0C2GU60_9BILA|nr:hypothetical protein ANCDUO_07192 [Ancylostoma duodenale]